MFLVGEPAFAQVSFTDDRDMAAKVVLYKNDLRKAYDLILYAHSHDKGQKIGVEYVKLLKEFPTDPRVRMEFILAWEVGMSVFPFDRLTTEQIQYREQLERQGADAGFEKMQMKKEMEKTPEGLIYLALMSSNHGPDYEHTLEYARKAQKLAPDWAPTHLWVGTAYSGLSRRVKDPAKAQEYARLALIALKKAESLKPRMREGNINYTFAHTYVGMGKPALALPYVKRRLAALSGASSESNRVERKYLRDWQERLKKQVATH